MTPTAATGLNPGTGLLDRWARSVMATYAPPPIALVRGAGCLVWDDQGREYVDLVGGIAVNLLGHAHPAVVEAVGRQIATLGHVSNLVANAPAAELAERLLDLTGRDGRVFFCNSGAEANEAAFKLARRTGRAVGGRRRGVVPRPDDGCPRAHRPASETRAVRAAARRGHVRAVRRRAGTAVGGRLMRPPQRSSSRSSVKAVWSRPRTATSRPPAPSPPSRARCS